MYHFPISCLLSVPISANLCPIFQIAKLSLRIKMYEGMKGGDKNRFLV
jgi:hypothetical protein